MSETHCVTIQIVGTVEGGETFHKELADLFDRLQRMLPETMPNFVLANPPATVTTFELLGPPTARRIDVRLSQAEQDLITAARKVAGGFRGDGNGRVRIAAHLADELHRAVEQWERFP